MKNKMAEIQIYQQFNLKNKLSKEEEQRQNHGSREHFDGFWIEGVLRGMGEKVRRLRNTNR